MARPFSRTLRCLDSERRLSAVGLSLVTLLLLGWLGWLFFARISVFEVTPLGRLEVDRAAHPIESQVAGRVLRVPVTVGRQVAAGDVLIELESEKLAIGEKEQEARLAALEAELAAAREELALRQQTLDEGRRTAGLTLDEARTRAREAEIQARFAAQEAERAAVLHGEGQLPRVEMERLDAEAERLQALAATYRVAVDKQESQERTRELELRSDLAQLGGAVARLEGQVAATAAAIEQIRYQISQHSIRAPRPGEVVELVELTAGAQVEEGERLGTILAAGQIKVIADFAPGSALGRVGTAQRAQIRLDGFPWTQYGMLKATVTRVAGEPRDGKLRAELEVIPETATRIPVQHGLTGTVEVEVESISPALLLLRTLGRVIKPQTPASPR